MIKKLTPNLMVSDIGESLRFYRGLGFEAVMQVPDDNAPEFAILKTGSVELMLQTQSSLETDIPAVGARSIASSCILYVDVDDVHALHESLSTSAKVVHPLRETFYGATEFYVEDPDGYVVGFAEHAGQ